MRIIHINDIASVGTTIAHAQREILGHEVYFVNIIPRQTQGGLRGKLSTLLERIKLVWRARKLISKLNPDIVHLHYSTSAIWMLGVKAKLVVHAHGSDIRLQNNDYIRRVVNYCGLRSASVVICATPDLLKYAMKYHKSCYFVPNPINTEVYKCDRNSSRNNGGMRILLLAVPSVIKGFETAAKAITRILRSYPNVTATIFKNEVSLNFFASNSLTGIQLIDAVSQVDVPKLICDHDIIVGQFLLGAFGMSELQAMSCGRPVICNGVFNSSLFTLPPHLQANNEDQIFKHIEDLLSSTNDDFLSIASKSRDWIESNHGLRSVVMEIEHYYKND